ncbi:MAG TPA: hypothetical protein VE978_17550 [Chitinophagales bacterium]|nr:hypothetical protein [Chitinophagales bacterium]
MEEKNKNQLSEPETAYNKKRIHFFKSFEEEEEFTLIARLRMTPEERLALVTQMPEQLYEEELRRPHKYYRITFDC